jgi:hypothetical protein
MLDTASAAPGNRGMIRLGAQRERDLGRTDVGQKGSRTLKNPLQDHWAPKTSLIVRPCGSQR